MENPLRANERLREERLRHGWSQQKVADQLGIAVVTVNRWERGKQQPTGYYRLKLSTLFDKSAEELGLIEEETEAYSPASIEDPRERTAETSPISSQEQEYAPEDPSPDGLLRPSTEKEEVYASLSFSDTQSNRRSLNKKGILLLLVALLLIVITVPITFFLLHSTRRDATETSSHSFHTVLTPPASFMPPSKWLRQLDDPMTKAQHNVQWDVDANCVFRSNGYNAVSQGTNYCNYGESSVNNFSAIAYSIDITFYKGSMGGLVFRLVNNNYYGFYITTAGKYRILRHTANDGGSDYTRVYKSSALIHTGFKQKNTLSVYAQGTSLVFWINGQQVDKLTDPTYKSGTIGTFVGNPDDNSNSTTEALFQNAQVWTP